MREQDILEEVTAPYFERGFKWPEADSDAMGHCRRASMVIWRESRPTYEQGSRWTSLQLARMHLMLTLASRGGKAFSKIRGVRLVVAVWILSHRWDSSLKSSSPGGP